jgi:hypothetical protein
MLLVDDLVLSPYRGLLWVFKEIHDVALEELEGEAERIREQLTDLYMLLETGEITDEEFDEREAALLDRLDTLEEQGLGGEEDDDEDDEEDEDDDEDEDEDEDDDEDDEEEDEDDEEVATEHRVLDDELTLETASCSGDMDGGPDHRTE